MRPGAGDRLERHWTAKSFSTILARIATDSLTKAAGVFLKPVGQTNVFATDQLPFTPSQEAVIPVTNRSQAAEVPLGIWGANLPAPTDVGAKCSLADAITNVFADLGHFNARFTVDFVSPS